MGIKAIMAAKKVIIMAFSSSKSDIVLNTIEGEVSVKHPATFLQNHQNADFVLDLVAAEKLSRFVCPWTVKEVNTNSNFIYDEYWTKRAVIWLSFHEKKPILRLVNNNFEDNGLLELLV
jgi:glucosamine-6-phosphate deaminase